MPFLRRVKRTRDGSFEIRLSGPERDLLRSLPGQLRDLLGSDDPALERLFPPAYRHDPDRDADYQQLMHDDLRRAKETAIDVFEATIDERRLDEEQLASWLGALNDLRLVLGTRLEVTEDMYGEELAPDDPRSPALSLYAYLGWLQEQVVDALAETLPDTGRD